jgi:hypothetical protein
MPQILITVLNIASLAVLIFMLSVFAYQAIQAVRERSGQRDKHERDSETVQQPRG